MTKPVMLLIFCLISPSLSVAAESPINIATERKRLISGSAQEQQDAMSRLRASGSKANKELLDIVEHGDAGAKTRAANVLGGILEDSKNRTPETFDALDKLASDKDLSTVDSVMIVLTKAKGENRARAIVKRLAATHADERIRAKAASDITVVSNNDPADIPALKGMLKDRSEFVRLRAAGSLGVLGNNEGLRQCLDVLNRPADKAQNRDLRLEAAVAAGKIGDNQALPALRKLAQSRGPVKGRALIAIRTIELHGLKSDSERVSYLKSALKDQATARWAGYELQNLNTPDALNALKDVAGDKSDPNAAGEAAEVLVRINAIKK